jgi:hypothetical protein
VVADGVTVTDTPLVTDPTPPIVPVPPLNTADSVVELPAVIDAAPAVKLLITGAEAGGVTVIVAVAVAVAGVVAALVTVSVYIVVADGFTVTAVPLVTVPTPPIVPVPPLNTAVSVVDFPAVIVAAPAEKLVIDGGVVAAAGLRVDIAVEKVLLLPTPLVLSPVK